MNTKNFTATEAYDALKEAEQRKAVERTKSNAAKCNAGWDREEILENLSSNPNFKLIEFALSDKG
jgi:hypothetical protein